MPQTQKAVQTALQAAEIVIVNEQSSRYGYHRVSDIIRSLTLRSALLNVDSAATTKGVTCSVTMS